MDFYYLLKIHRAIKEAYKQDKNAFEKGCGRKTLWVKVVLQTESGKDLWDQYRFTPSKLRRILESWSKYSINGCVKGVNPQTRYTTFKLKALEFAHEKPRHK